MESGTHYRLREKPRVERVLLDARGESTAYHIARWISRYADSRVVDLVIENRRRRRRHIQENVVEGGVISDRITPADDGGIIFPEKHFCPFAITHSWRPGKPDAGRPVVFVSRNFREGARRERQALEPNCGAGIALPGNC